MPIDAFAEDVALGKHGVGQTDAHDRADERVGTGGWKSKIPGAQVPDDRGDEQSEDHREAGGGADVDHQFDGQEGEDAEGDGAGGSEHADEVPQTGPDNGDVGLKRVGVDHGGDGVGCVVKTVDEFKAQCQTDREDEEEAGGRAERRNVG